MANVRATITVDVLLSGELAVSAVRLVKLTRRPHFEFSRHGFCCLIVWVLVDAQDSGFSTDGVYVFVCSKNIN